MSDPAEESEQLLPALGKAIGRLPRHLPIIGATDWAIELGRHVLEHIKIPPRIFLHVAQHVPSFAVWLFLISTTAILEICFEEITERGFKKMTKLAHKTHKRISHMSHQAQKFALPTAMAAVWMAQTAHKPCQGTFPAQMSHAWSMGMINSGKQAERFMPIPKEFSI